MNFNFEYRLEEGWPVLAWIVECTEANPTLLVRHGSQVETRDKWFCEAIWDGDFEAGDFDNTDLVFGSGVRLRENHTVFVSSGTTVDRLQYFNDGNKFYVSNSLACLLAVTAIKVNPTYESYYPFFKSIDRGIDSYEKILPTQNNIIKLLYFRNLKYNGNLLSEVDKSILQRNFGSFADYHGFLRRSISKIAENMRSEDRNHQFDMIGALSSGYDSTTTAVLAKEAGMKKVFSFYSGRGGKKDHGKDTAEILELDLTMLNRYDWRNQSYAEIPYFASTGHGADIIFSSAKELLQGQVLLTGFHGDKVWGKDTKALGPDIVRGDISGLSFTENRLELGCIHFPVPFMGVRQIEDIHRISNSEELRPWHIAGDYSRPICRRIIEDAGVPRGLFGTKKKVATNLFHAGETQITDKTRADFYLWLKKNTSTWETRGLVKPKVPGRLLFILRDRFYLISRFLRILGSFTPLKARNWLARQNWQMQRSLTLRINMVQHIFPWAIERIAERYIQKENNSSSVNNA